MVRLHKGRSFMEACKILDQIITWKPALPIIPILDKSGKAILCPRNC